MIKVYIPSDYEFNYKQSKKLYKKCQKLIGDNQEFKDIVKNRFFYSFFDEDIFIGFMYFYYENNKLIFNGFANRHLHKQTVQCVKMTFDWFDCDIWAKSKNKPAILCLLRSGFKKVSENLYKYEREK